MTSAIANLFPTPRSQVSVAFVCSEIDHELAGVWLTPLSAIAKTNVTLHALKVLPAGQPFAVQFAAATLQEFIDAVWQLIENNDRRLDDNGTPDQSGPLEIKERSTLTSPTDSTLQLVIKGTCHWSKLHLHLPFDFSLTGNETLGITPVRGGLGIVTSTPSQKVDLDEAKVREVQAAVRFISLFGVFSPYR